MIHFLIRTKPFLLTYCILRITKIYFFVCYSILIHLPPQRFHNVGRCWNRTQESHAAYFKDAHELTVQSPKLLAIQSPK